MRLVKSTSRVVHVQSLTVKVDYIGIANGYTLERVLLPCQIRPYRDGPGPQHGENNDKERRQGVDQSTDRWHDGVRYPFRRLYDAVEVRQEELVHELGLDLVALFADSTEEDAAQQTVAIEPVGLSAEILVCDGIGSVPDILPTCKLRWDPALEGARGEPLGMCYRSKVAG